jgi:preprotein translocase subunit YajC
MDSRQILTFLPLVLIIVLMYFLMIRPQSKKRKQAEAMRSALKVGDKITTIGGIKGKIVKIYTDDTVAIETGSGGNKSRMEITRWAVSAVDQEGSRREVKDEPEEKAPASEEEVKEDLKQKIKKPRKLTKKTEEDSAAEDEE